MWQPTRKETLALAVVGIVLLTSVFVRLDGMTTTFPVDDEIIVMVAATKLNTPHPGYDPREYNYEHPPLGKLLLGWALDKTKKYPNTAGIQINLYAYSYLASPELRDQLFSFRAWTAIIGILFLVALFFLGKELFDTRTGILAVLFAGISIGFINVSRIVFQDVFLPLFITLALLFAIRYAKGDLKHTWNGIPTPYFDLLLALFFMGASLLTRIGQPPFVLAGIILGLWGVKKKWLPFVIGTALMGAVILYIYPLQLILTLASQTYAGTFLQRVNLSIVTDTLNMTSYSFVGGILLTLAGGAWYHRKKIPDVKKHIHALQPIHRITLAVMGITILAAVFTQLGLLSRYYIVFLILPLIYFSHAIRKYVPRQGKILLVVLLLLDCILLVSASPNLREYSLVPGMSPFIQDKGEEFHAFISLLAQQGVSEYFSNDARIVLMDPRARPVPPYHQKFILEARCNQKFFTEQKGKLLIYNPSYQPIGKNTFLCPLLTNQTLERVEGIHDPFGFEWYRIMGKN